MNLFNKHILIAFIVSFVFSYKGIAQVKEPIIDSLENELKLTTNSKTHLDIHKQLCWILRNKDPERSIFHGNSALALIEKNHFDDEYAQVYNYLGVVHRNKGEYNYALDLYNQALDWAIQTEDKIQTAYSYNNIGGIYTLKNNYSDAIEYIQKAKVIFEELGETDGIGYANVNLGNIYRHLKNFKESMQYLAEAEKIKLQLNDTIGLTVVRQLQADILKEEGNLTEAEKILKQLTINYQHNQDLKGLAIVKNELGVLELTKKNYEKAIDFFEQAEQLNSTLSNKQGLAYNAINLGISYQKIGFPQEAIKNLQTGLQIGSELGDKTTLLKAYDAFSNVYLEQKNYLKALESKNEYLETYKSLYNWEQSEQVNTIRGKYESEKQYLEQKLLEEKTAKQELDNYYSKLHLLHLTIGAGIIVFLLIIISLLLYFNSVKAKKNKEAAEILKLKNSSLQEANLTKEKFLSIIGHDLKNPFNSVLGLSNLIIDQWKQLDDEEKLTISNEINGSSQTIYELLDNLLLWSRTQTSKTETHPELFDLNENIQNIYEIFRNQANFKSITVRLDISGKKMVFADMNMIATVIRNLLSNALKFTHQGGKITISTKSKADMVEFSISDNGKGILPDDLKKIFESKGIHNSKGTANESGSGLGLLLAKDFIQQNNGIIWVESIPNKGSQFTFTLPTS